MSLTPLRLLNICLLLVLVLLVLPIYVNLGVTSSLDHIQGKGTVGGLDFKAYYLAAHLLRQGQDFYDPAAQMAAMLSFGLPANDSLYIYPPLLAILLVPLTALPIAQAAQVWFFFNLALYGLTLMLLVKVTDLDRSWVPGLLILASLFAPALFTLHKGQANILVLFLLVATYWLYERKRPLWAGVALALATMVKILPGLLILYLVWRKEYKTAAVAVTAIVLVTTLGLLVVGLSPHITFLHSVLPALTQPRPNPSNLSLAGFLSLLLVENPSTSSLTDNASLWRSLTLLTSILLLALTFLACSRHGDRRTGLEMSLFVTAMPLLSQIGWVDFYTLLLLPYAILVKHLIARGTKAQVGIAVLSFLLLNSSRLVDLWTHFVRRSETLLGNALVLGMPLYGALLVWGLLVWVLWKGNDEG